MNRILPLVVFLAIAGPVLAQADTLRNDTGNTRDTVGAFRVVEVEAAYPGGGGAWRGFLETTLNPDRATKDVPKKIKRFEQTAIVQFIVCTDGTLCNIEVINDVLPSIRKEAERAIRLSGTWLPAVQNGRKVKAYRRQPITFMVQ